VARDEARIFARIWKDTDFRALTRSAQGTYAFLLSQPDLSYCGMIPLRVGKWARTAAGMTGEDVWADLKALTETGTKAFVVVDEETEEVFVRSLIRNDGIWKQPNLMKAARDAARLVESPKIRAALAEELKRIPIEESDSWMARRVLRDFLEDFGEVAWFPCDIPSGKGQGKGSAKGSAKGSGNPSGDPSQGKGVRGKGKNSPSVTPTGSSSSSSASHDDAGQGEQQDEGDPVREDVERVCAHLAERVEAGGSKPPSITKGWRDAARLLMDLDGRTERQVHNMIDWCQADQWWRSRVLSMPKLRSSYDSMRLQALEQQAPGKSGNNAGAAAQSGARAKVPTAEELEQTEIDI
jgi:hypothetical protein